MTSRAALHRILPGEGGIAGEGELRHCESDGLTAYRQPPLMVVFRETVEHVDRILVDVLLEEAERVKGDLPVISIFNPRRDASGYPNF